MNPLFRPPLSDYRAVGVVFDNKGERAELLVPPAREVVRIADLLADGIYPNPNAELPIDGANIWDLDNWGTMSIVLAGYREWRGNETPCLAANIRKVNPQALLWLVGGYLTIARNLRTGILWSAEQAICNGSTWVQDLMEGGYWVKDPPSVPHDIEWASRYTRVPDAFGRIPDFHRSNIEYRDCLIGMGHEEVAALRFEALESGLAAAKWALQEPGA